MSQAVTPDLEPSSDLSSPPADPSHQDTGSCPDAPAPASCPDSPVVETSTVDTCSGETAEVADHTETETSAERQVTECDQPVNLDPENPEDLEVCMRRWDVLTHAVGNKL